MGQSAETITDALGRFEQRYAEFRRELPPREQQCFDALVERARRHSNALNRRPILDFERPLILALQIEAMRELQDTREDLRRTQQQLREACHALADAGLVVRRVSPPDAIELGRVGQTRLSDHQAPGAVPA